ncbi:ComEA family DNA-binding protein [Knoellia sp. CPCC 206453]|uniref:ComEA family DNA-binding protein n=1 Tax=Knoellia pratensis TaxID=3404796 RepID=UPI00361D19E3
MPFRREPDTVSPRALARVREGGGPGDRTDRVDGGEVEVRGDVEEGGRHRPLEVPRGPVFELPLSLRGARWVPSRSAVIAVLAVIAVVVVVFGVRIWLAGAGDGAAVGPRATAGSQPTGVSRGTSTLSRASPGAPSATVNPSAGQGPGVDTAGPVVVHVVGQVAKPGVYRMTAGERVGDAVTAAGGATRAADLTAVNLARVLIDGEQIVVPKPGEVVAAPGAAGSGTSAGSGAGSGGAVAGSGSGSTGGTVSLNSADLSALDTLPGVGPVLAQRILDWRTEHGRFTNVEELGEVSGIGEKLLAQLTPKVTL